MNQHLLRQPCNCAVRKQARIAATVAIRPGVDGHKMYRTTIMVPWGTISHAWIGRELAAGWPTETCIIHMYVWFIALHRHDEAAGLHLPVRVRCSTLNRNVMNHNLH